MSHDIDVWSVRPADLPDVLPEDPRWVREETPYVTHWLIPTRRWRIVVERSTPVLAEDVPASVHAALPGIAHLTRTRLEPVGAPASAHALLRKTARAIAKQAHGAFVEDVDAEVHTPSGVERVVLAPTRRTEPFSILELSWWFVAGPLLEPGGFARLLDLFERMLPEALPRRYDLTQPPRFRYEREGRAHFEAYLDEHARDHVIWYTTRGSGR